MSSDRYRRGVGIAILIGLAAVAAGCQRGDEDATRVTVIDETIDIAEPYDGPLGAGSAVVLQSIAQGLVRFDARGQIEPGLAERWNVSDDGLSYIFRLQSMDWPDGRKVTAHQVARLIRRAIAARSRNALRDSLGAVSEVVAMTDRVIEIRLSAPRPNLLQLLAQPELAVLREGQGTGPFRIDAKRSGRGTLTLVREVALPDEEGEFEERVALSAASASAAIRTFVAEETDLVLGGTYADLPLTKRVKLPRRALQFDPAAGLFGLAPAIADGPVSDPEVRSLLTRAVDREALIEALGVPGLVGRATILEPGLESVPDPVSPPWTAAPLGDRLPDLIAEADRLFGESGPPKLRIALPPGPGTDILINRLRTDWGMLGISVEAVAPGAPADLMLIDAVAPSASPAWYLRRFRCGIAIACSEEADRLLDAARAAPITAQRAAFLAEAARVMEAQQLFVPIAAPIRWSLVGSDVEGFAGNRFARHTLTGLRNKLSAERLQ